jgi:ribulose bisphosphate carboxylase small subunit
MTRSEAWQIAFNQYKRDFANPYMSEMELNDRAAEHANEFVKLTGWDND